MEGDKQASLSSEPGSAFPAAISESQPVVRLNYASPGTVKSELPPEARYASTFVFATVSLLILSSRVDDPIYFLRLCSLFLVPPMLFWIALRRRPIHWVRVAAFVVCTAWAVAIVVDRLATIARDPNFPRPRFRSELTLPLFDALVPIGIYVSILAAGAALAKVRARRTSRGPTG